MFCWWIAGWRKWRASAGGMSISRRCAINTSARGYRWRGWNPTKPPAFSTPPARPANLKACSVTSADMRWRWRPRWTPFWRQSGRCVLLCFGYRLGGGHSYIVYAPLLAGMATIVYEGLPTWPDCGVWWKIVEKYQVSRMFSAPTAIRVLKNSLPLKFANTISRRWKCSIWLENRWTSRPPVG